MPRLLQLPYLRIPFQGRIGVPIFAFLTGFVCAYKPLKLAYQHGNVPAALKSVARSAFRRPPRLMLPAMIATFFSFVLSCFGAYTAATRCDSFWVRFDAPGPVPFRENVRRLFTAWLTTWTSTDNPFDRHQWAMRPLLIGAFQVYVVLAATIGMRFKYRILVHILMIFYWLFNVGYLTGELQRSRSLWRGMKLMKNRNFWRKPSSWHSACRAGATPSDTEFHHLAPADTYICCGAHASFGRRVGRLLPARTRRLDGLVDESPQFSPPPTPGSAQG